MEAALLGGEAVVLEKRCTLNRENILHLFPSVVHHLASLGHQSSFCKKHDIQRYHFAPACELYSLVFVHHLRNVILQGAIAMHLFENGSILLGVAGISLY